MRRHVAVENVPGLFGRGDEVLDLRGAYSVVERVGGGDRADENQHDQPHALLAVIGAVVEADPGAGADHEKANWEGRRVVGFRRLVEHWIAQQPPGKQQQEGSHRETDERRKQQRLQDLYSLLPIHARGTGVRIEELVSEPHADDGTHHGVRAGGWQSQPPRAQIPQNCGDEQREHHGEARAGAYLQYEIDGQKRDDGEGHCSRGGEYPRQIAQPRPRHRDVRLERIGINDGGHRVGGIVEAVHEFEAESDGQSEPQQHVRPHAGGFHRVQIARNVKDDVAEGSGNGTGEKAQADSAGTGLKLAVNERGSPRRALGKRSCNCG